MNVKNFVLIGAGNVAASLGPALVAAGYVCRGVLSRTAASAEGLARRLETVAATAMDDLPEADMVVVSVTDAALPTVAAAVARRWPRALLMHTAGSGSMNVFASVAQNYGVLYPMQTFTKARPLSFAGIPLFVEGSTPAATEALQAVARKLSRRVYMLSEAQRRRLHLAAVFAANFANHCYALSARVLQEIGVPFDVMLGLTDEVAQKVHRMPPAQAQTGPAARGDHNTLLAHEQLLAGNPQMLQIYRMMSASIEELSKQTKQ